MSTVLTGAATARVRLRGLAVDLTYTPVADELERRRRCGLVALPHREQLRTLFSIPSDVDLPRHALESRHLRLLRQTPFGAATVTRSTVTRHLVPAIRIGHVAAHGPATVGHLRALSVLRPFSTCSYRCDTTAVPSVRAEADRLGIGLDDGDAATVARPLVLRRHTPATWLLVEQATDALVAAAAL